MACSKTSVIADLLSSISFVVAGRVLHDSDLVRRVDEAEARIAELSIHQNRGSQTTQTAQKLGSVGFSRY